MAFFDPSWSVSRQTDVAQNANKRGNAQWDTLDTQNNENWKTAQGVSKSAIDTSKTWNDFADSEVNRYKTDYIPAEKKQLNDAMGWASPDRMARQRGMAMGSQRQAGDLSKQRALDTLESYGVDPGSGRFGGLDANLEAKTGAAMAAAGTMSDIQTELQGQQLLANAIQTGKAVPQVAAGAAGVGLQAGNQAVNAPLAATGVRAQTQGTPTQWAGIEQQAYKDATGAMVNAAQISAENERLAQQSSSGTGALIGGGLGALTKLAPLAMSFFGPAGAAAGVAGGLMGSGMLTGTGGIYRHGGMVRRFAEGGPVDDMDMDEGMQGPADMDGDEGMYVDPAMSPSGGAVTDDVDANIDGDPSQPAKINSGEFIMPADVVAWRGEAWMQKEIKKAREEMGKAQARPAQPEIKQVPSAISTRPPSFVPMGAGA